MIRQRAARVYLSRGNGATRLSAVEAPEVRYAKSGDVSIAYSVVGDGPFDLVFVTGSVFTALEYAWEGPPAEFFSKLASFSRLILFDKRGTGLSDRVSDFASSAVRMDDIRAVMDAAGSERAPP
jgi:pimeloyl-ACP methyl ester carboxylesterase